MPTKDKNAIEWFGADTIVSDEGRTVRAELEGFNAVDYDRPKAVTNEDGTQEIVLARRAAPNRMMVKTTAKNGLVAELTARYKMMREMFLCSPLDDKELWEKRRDIAYAEMQVARFREALEVEKAKEPRNPVQIQHLVQTVGMWRGTLLELKGE